MKKILLLLIFSLSATLVVALDTTDWKRLEKKPAASIVRDGGFEEKSNLWRNIGEDGWKLAGGAGRNGTVGLLIERGKRGSRVMVSQAFELQPDAAYEFGGWVHTENVTGRGASICIEWSNAETGKWLGGSYLGDIGGDSDWRELKGKFTMKKYPFPVRCRITFYLRPESLGRAAFDDVYVRPDTAEWNVGMIYPIQETVTTDDKSLELASFVTGEYNYPGASKAEQMLGVEIAGRQAYYPVKENRVVIKLNGLVVGEEPMKLQLLDTVNKMILDETTIPLKVTTPEERAGRTVQIDGRGRTLVDGKPFMPVGIFMTRLTREQIDAVAEAGFNTVLPYQSLNLSFTGEMSPDRVREVLDYCHEKGLKVIFSIKDAMPAGATNMIQKNWNGITDPIAISEAVVKAFKDHPALLAWYVCDEIQPTFVTALTALRRRINRLDLNHPTYAIYYQFNSYPRYLGCQDIFGIDPYPIRRMQDNDLGVVAQQASHAVKVQRSSLTGGTALWSAPQYTNLGVWMADAKSDPKVYHEKYRFPTVDELRAMIAMEMIYGSKGFIGYSYSSLFYGPDKDQFKNAWPVVREAVVFQHEMSACILSDAVPPALKVTVLKGTVSVGGFALPDGRVRVLAVAQGPGEFEAVIEMAPMPLKSRHGLIRTENPGCYRFSGNGIAFDMLESR